MDAAIGDLRITRRAAAVAVLALVRSIDDPTGDLGGRLLVDGLAPAVRLSATDGEGSFEASVQTSSPRLVRRGLGALLSFRGHIQQGSG